MKNLLVYYDPDLTTQHEDIPVPEYGPNEILIKVVVAGSNPKDWKHPMPNYFNIKVNQGDDAAGIVEAVGSEVTNFRPGDRVAGFHVMDTPRGTYAEYTVCPEQTVFHIPESLSFEEAATIPLAAYTAAVGLYRNLQLPLPFERADEKSGVAKTPLIINGASSAVGSFALQFALMNPSIGPIVVTAGKSAEHAKQLGADIIVDYRSPTISDDFSAALGGKKVHHVFDASNTLQSVKYLTPWLDPAGRYTCTTGLKKPEGDESVELKKWGGWFEQIWVGSVHDDNPAGGKLFGGVVSRILEVALKQGTFKPQPYEVIEGGLAGVLDALKRLRDRKGGNEKFVYRIAETPGL
ncbi:putative quinone oxidoreductase [Trichodelitschia bisporula]|uniref:Putative quinone oxidoreductase n=1 Tax=Trichodelitschia bisporula TaxID=703511 RepID=A0A6G1I3Y8_9PEZI|nr:putative quinone oxidoreductase [Trichodelitschia bisporula]